MIFRRIPIQTAGAHMKSVDGERAERKHREGGSGAYMEPLVELELNRIDEAETKTDPCALTIIIGGPCALTILRNNHEFP